MQPLFAASITVTALYNLTDGWINSVVSNVLLCIQEATFDIKGQILNALPDI